MSYKTIRDRLVEILNSVEGVQNVHAYTRSVHDESTFNQAFLTDEEGEKDRIAGWMLTRTFFDQPYPDLGTVIVDRTHRIEIQGFYTLEDSAASELSFQDLIDSVCNTLKEKYTLQGDDGADLDGVIMSRVIQVTEIGVSTFGHYIVHSCKILMDVTERVP